MFSAIKMFWGANSIPITGVIVLVLGLYIGSLHLRLGVSQGNEARLSGRVSQLEGVIKQTEAIGIAQQAEIKRLAEGAHAAVVAQSLQNQNDLSKMEKYYAKKLANSRIAANRMCQSGDKADNTSSGGMPGEGTGSGVPNEGTSDKVPSGRSFEESCAITTWMLLELQKHERSQQLFHQKSLKPQ